MGALASCGPCSPPHAGEVLPEHVDREQALLEEQFSSGLGVKPRYVDVSGRTLAWTKPCGADFFDPPGVPDGEFGEDGGSLAKVRIGPKRYARVDFKGRPHVWGAASKVVRCCGLEARLWGRISVQDIIQGSLGDCWFISAIAGVAENPDRVRACFPRSDARGGLSPDGCYVVRLHDFDAAGSALEAREIWVNDFVPCLEGDAEGAYKPAMARPTEGEIYVVLLEKALAKMLGSYAALKGGFTFLGYTYLAGAQCHRMIKARGGRLCLQDIGPGMFSRTGYRFHDHGELSPEEAWELVLAADRAESLMSCAWEGEGMESVSRDTGLVFHHAYTVVRAAELGGPELGGDPGDLDVPLRLLQCRNPWGNRKEWGHTDPTACPWCDASPLWAEHPAVALALDYQGPRADGLFWIGWDLFQEYGREIVISYLPGTEPPELLSEDEEEDTDEEEEDTECEACPCV